MTFTGVRTRSFCSGHLGLGCLTFTTKGGLINMPEKGAKYLQRTGLTGRSSLGVPGPPTVSVGPFYPDLQVRRQQDPTPPQQKPAFFFPKADCPEKDPGNPGYPLQVSQCLLRKGNPGIGRWWVGSGIPGNLPSPSSHSPTFLLNPTCAVAGGPVSPRAVLLVQAWPLLRGERVTQVLCALAHLS